MATPIKVSNGRNKASQFHKKLRKLGLKNCGSEYTGSFILKSKILKIQQFAKDNGLKYEINNDFGKRSNSYRGEYFQHNKPLFKFNDTAFYYCAYCGCIRNKRYITIDHLYPVAKVNTSMYYQNKLKKMGAKSVNSYQNLVAACMRCNSKKKTKMGLWLLRGKLGRHKIIWLISTIIKFMLILTVLYTAYLYRDDIFNLINNFLSYINYV